MADDGIQHAETYPGRGWGLASFTRIRDWPEFVTAPLAVSGALVLLALFGVGVFLIASLVGRVLVGGTDTVPAASAALTAIAAIFGAVFLFWRTLVAHWQARANQDQAAIARESHYTTLFTKAVEQLGATREVKETATVEEGDGRQKREPVTKTEPNLEVRLGAIYALERIAQDSERDHWAIMEVLCAYVRNPQNCGAPLKRPTDLQAGTSAYYKWIGELPRHVDIQAALYAVGRRQLKLDRVLDLSRVSLQDTTLASFNFERANFRRSNLESISFINALLTRALFIEAELTTVLFDKADLRGSFFSKAKINLVFFDKSNMSDAWFDETNLKKAYFREAKLIASMFDAAVIFTASFDGADMTKASLNGAAFHDASFVETNLTGATLFGTYLGGAISLTSEQLASAIGDASTILPEGCARPTNWPDRQLSWQERARLVSDLRGLNA